MTMVQSSRLEANKCQTLLNSNNSQGWKQTSARPCSVAIGLKVVVLVVVVVVVAVVSQVPDLAQ